VQKYLHFKLSKNWSVHYFGQYVMDSCVLIILFNGLSNIAISSSDCKSEMIGSQQIMIAKDVFHT
jgi:hypothetical protein